MGRIDAILDLIDTEYRSAFIRAVSMEWSGFSFIIPGDNCKLKKHDAKLVITDKFNDTLLQQLAVDNASADIRSVYMTEYADQESVFNEPYMLYKYDSASAIISKLRYIMGEGTFLESSDKRCISVSVITDEGGIGTTTFTLALAAILNSNEFKSLYISLSPVNICRNYGDIFDDRPDSKLVFPRFLYSCIIEKPLPVPSVIDSKNGIDFFRCPTFNYHYDDFSLRVSDTIRCQLSNYGYRMVIYDVGNHFTANSRDIICSSDIVVYLHSIRNPTGCFNLPFDSEKVIKVITANYDEIERCNYGGFYIPRCRAGNFYGLENEYGIEVARIAECIGGQI